MLTRIFSVNTCEACLAEKKVSGKDDKKCNYNGIGEIEMSHISPFEFFPLSNIQFLKFVILVKSV